MRVCLCGCLCVCLFVCVGACVVGRMRVVVCTLVCLSVRWVVHARVCVVRVAWRVYARACATFAWRRFGRVCDCGVARACARAPPRLNQSTPLVIFEKFSVRNS